MRKITMEVWENGFRLEDEDEQFVDVEFDDNKRDSYFISYLLGDESVETGMAPRKIALVEAFKLLGVEYD